jgi:putative Mg2+ transporter-C (MgtC) family protein
LIWQFEILGELAIAMLLGASIGFEREFAAKPAGLRTHMMVCAAAALLVALGEVMLLRFATGGHKELVASDPMRIVGAVITGVSFLGAGSIFRRPDSDSVEGLTTAASILLTAGIGMCVALRQWVLAIGGAVMVVLVLRGLVFIERWIAKNRSDADTRRRLST